MKTTKEMWLIRYVQPGQWLVLVGEQVPGQASECGRDSAVAHKHPHTQCTPWATAQRPIHTPQREMTTLWGVRAHEPGGWGGGCLGPWPAPADPPTHTRKIFLRQKMKLIKGAGNLRPMLGTQNFFLPLTHPSLSNKPEGVIHTFYWRTNGNHLNGSRFATSTPLKAWLTI